MITRDAVQGFIDGLKAGGSDLKELQTTVELWLKNHPLYPSDENTIRRILNDLDSYRK
jgi:hypothetical protein